MRQAAAPAAPFRSAPPRQGMDRSYRRHPRAPRPCILPWTLPLRDPALVPSVVKSMSGIPGYARIAFMASQTAEAQEARSRLAQRYGGTDPADADVIVALGGDGFMLQTLHSFMN